MQIMSQFKFNLILIKKFKFNLIFKWWVGGIVTVLAVQMLRLI